MDYGSTDAVEYSITIEYDWADMSIGEEKAEGGAYKLRGDSLRKRSAQEIENETTTTLREGQERLDRLSSTSPLTPNPDGSFEL